MLLDRHFCYGGPDHMIPGGGVMNRGGIDRGLLVSVVAPAAEHALVGERVELRALCLEYVAEYLTMFSPIVCYWLHADVGAERAYIEQQCIQQARGLTQFFCIFDKQYNRLIGAIEINAASHRGHLYAWLNEQYWGGGRYQEALALATHAYFVTTDAPFFTAHVDVANKRSYHALRKMNFAPCGLIEGPHGKQYIMVLRNTRLVW